MSGSSLVESGNRAEDANGETAPLPPLPSGVDPTIVGNIPLFAKLSREEVLALCGFLRSKRFAMHEPIVFIGDEGSEFYIVQVGKVAVSQPNEEGKEVGLAELGPGHFFGEISLLDGGPRTATVRAGSDVILLSLDRADFVEFLMKHPAAAVHILTVLGARQRDLLERLKGIRNVNEMVLGQQTKLQRVLSRLATIFASEKFLLANLLFFGAWVALHLILARRAGRVINLIDDPPTFFWLGFMITVEAIVISMFVLNAQRRQAERDRVRADFEYQVNVKAHINVTELHRKVDKLLEAAGVKEGKR
jgi:uncharacterized membrane protein